MQKKPQKTTLQILVILSILAILVQTISCGENSIFGEESSSSVAPSSSSGGVSSPTNNSSSSVAQSSSSVAQSGNFLGDGTPQNPYEIADASQLAALAAALNNSSEATRNAHSDKHYKLTANITLSGNWMPIGVSAARPFRGVFDGNGKVISGLTINAESNFQGLFGYIIGGVVKNLGVENININGSGRYLGGIAGRIDSSSVISNCYTTGAIIGNAADVGGVVGRAEIGNAIDNCYSTAAVSGANDVGGIAGSVITSGRIANNAALNPSVIGTGSNVGRVSGRAATDSEGNVAFAGMLNANGTTEWSSANESAKARNGTDMPAIYILADGKLGNNFSAPVWTTQGGKLPGFGEAREIPSYLANLQHSSSSLASSSSSSSSAAKQQGIILGEPVSYGGEVYETVVIGRQTWFRRNLNVMHKNGTSSCYDDGTTAQELKYNCDTYGRLYSRSAALSACPAGFRLPNNADWEELRDFVNNENPISGFIENSSSRHLKDANSWRNCGPQGSGEQYLCEDTYGFSAMPGGALYCGDSKYEYRLIGSYSEWWSASEEQNEWHIEYDTDIFEPLRILESCEIYIRCLKED
jgi:uncharacterized protein (TIGR02145 family)